MSSRRTADEAWDGDQARGEDGGSATQIRVECWRSRTIRRLQRREQGQDRVERKPPGAAAASRNRQQRTAVMTRCLSTQLFGGRRSQLGAGCPNFARGCQPCERGIERRRIEVRPSHRFSSLEEKSSQTFL